MVQAPPSEPPTSTSTVASRGRLSLRLLPILCAGLLLALLLGSGMPGVEANAANWEKRLAKGGPDEQYKVIVDAGKQKDLSAAAPLLNYARESEHAHLAVAAGDALRQMDADALKKDKAVQKFMKRMARIKEEGELLNLARVLGAWGAPWLDKELAKFASGRRSPAVQTEALFMLGNLPIQDPEKDFPKTRSAVLKAIDKGRTDEIKCAACSAAAGIGSKEFIEELMPVATRHRGDYAGLYAIWALKQIGHKGGLKSFLHVLGSNPKRQTRQACLKGITELASLDDVDALISLSRHGKKDYRDAALLALGRIAWRALEKKKQAEAAQEITGEEKPLEGKGGCGAFPVTDEPPIDIPEKVISRMIEVVAEDRSWEVRDAARQGLIRIGKVARNEVAARIPSMFDFKDLDTTTTAMELAGLFQLKDTRDDLIKVSLLDDNGDKAWIRRLFAMRALEGVDGEGAVEELKKHIRPSKKVRDTVVRAITTLGYIRKRPAFDLLVANIDEEHPEEVLRELEIALERLTGHRFGRNPDRWKKWIEIATNPFHPGVAKFDRTENRREAITRGLYGLTPTTERAVEKGLRWLAMQEKALGQYDGAADGHNGVPGCEPAYTGLALLSYLGAGYNSREGKYREAIRRSTEFLAATQYYDGGFPVQAGGDSSWIYAYLIAMANWGVNESYALSGDPTLKEPSQWGIDYLVRNQTLGQGWRYGPRADQSDTSCTSWVMMTLKTAQLSCLDVAQRSLDAIDHWLYRCSTDVTGEVELLKDLADDYDYEVGYNRYFQASGGYFPLEDAKSDTLQQVSMTAVMMVCRFFQGWKRSHPFMIGSANYLKQYLPQWMKGLETGMAIAWYHYYWYYGTLAFHQMGGTYWRIWNNKIKKMYPENQKRNPPELAGSWDADTAVYSGGRIFSTAMSIMTLETYYRFSPLMSKEQPEDDAAGADKGKEKDADKK